MNKEEKRFDKTKAFESVFPFAVCLGSKIGYPERNPDHLVIFNARVYDLETFEKHKNGKIKNWFDGQPLEIWYGDLDLSRDLHKLHMLSRKIGSFVITRESGDPVITIY